jgi:hypothetical protein
MQQCQIPPKEQSYQRNVTMRSHCNENAIAPDAIGNSDGNEAILPPSTRAGPLICSETAQAGGNVDLHGAGRK